MNRWIRTAASAAALLGTLALLPTGVALANDGASSSQDGGHRHQRPMGLLGAALHLDSLSADQRTAIESLAAGRRTATQPVRAADAQVLTELARQVEQASIDPKALAPALAAEDSASNAATAAERDALNHLHSILTPAQRGEVVDRLTAHHAANQAHRGGPDAGHGRRDHERWGAELGLTPDQRAQVAANLRAERQADGGPGMRQAREARLQALESFRGDSFDPSALVRTEERGERAEHLAAAMVPVLTPAQRGTLASALRRHAAHEGHGSHV